MNEQTILNDQHLPVYNIKAVARLVGLLPVTLRAWERRYGLPSPQRGDQGYRLYSEYDLRILRWLKRQLDAGMSIGRAIEYLQELRSSGQDPAQQTVSEARGIERPASLEYLSQQLYEHLTHFEENGATGVMRRAFALYAVDQVLVGVVQPTLVHIGEAWRQDELPVAVEHYATQFCMQHLMSLLAASPPAVQPGTIVAACAPGEMHQIGLLIVVVMLRWQGWDVKYLGPDLKLERLQEALRPLRPRLLLFSATRPESANAMLELAPILEQFPAPRPIVVLGGQGFKEATLAALKMAHYIEATPAETVKRIEALMTAGS